MSKDEIIAMLREQVARLEADNARLREQLMDITNAVMDMVRMRATEQADQAESTADKRSTWRDQKRSQRANVREMSGGHPVDMSAMSGGSPADCPVDMGGLIGGSTNVPPSSGVTSPPPSSPPQVTPLPTLPVVPPEVSPAARSVVPDEDWQAFRVVFPKTDRTSWKEAEAEWRKLNPADRAAALLGARKYDPEPQYRKAAQSWLRARRWETVDDAPFRNGNGHQSESKGRAAMREWMASTDSEGRPLDSNVIEGELV